jgi:hypothetical protein
MTYLDEHIKDIVVKYAKEVKPEMIEYLCIKDYVMDDGTLAYRKGLIYTTDGTLDDEGYFKMPSIFDKTHKMDTSGDFYEYFVVKKTTYGTGEDSIVNSVIQSFKERSEVGFKKYGTTLDRDDYNLSNWLNEAQQEAMDFVLYLEAAKNKIKNAGINL